MFAKKTNDNLIWNKQGFTHTHNNELFFFSLLCFRSIVQLNTTHIFSLDPLQRHGYR